jgi:hypothetical protein
MKNQNNPSNETQSFIKLSRKVRKHWLWKSSRKKTKFEAWLDLLFRANYDAHKEPHGHDLIEIKRGEILCSQEGLAQAWGWDRSAVRHFMKMLESDRMITLKVTTKFTVITLCNYATYNDKQPTKDQQKTNDATTDDQRYNTDKNIENNKNEKEDVPFEIFWEAYGKKEGKKDSLAKWNKLTLSDKKKIIEILPAYIAKTPNTQYRKDPKTFLHARVWEDEAYSSSNGTIPMNVIKAVSMNENDQIVYENGKIYGASRVADILAYRKGEVSISIFDRKIS